MQPIDDLIAELSHTDQVELPCDDFIWSRQMPINNVVDAWQDALPVATPLVLLAPFRLVRLKELVYTEESLTAGRLIAILQGGLAPECCPPPPYIECLMAVRLGRRLFIRNGNHRVYLLRRLGYESAWVRVFNGNRFLRKGV